jgi:ADP-ribose pyrophosphatase
MKPWKTLSKKTLLNLNKFLSVEQHTIEISDGRIIDNWPWLVTPDYVNVAAVTYDGKFLCFRQTKYGVEGTTLAPVGGYIETGEDPLIAAQRELLEETGYESPQWTPLGTYVVDGNRGAGKAYLFLAENAVHVTTPHADDLEEQELLHLTRTEVETALNTGEFKVLAWPTVMALALLRLKSTN